MPVPQLAVREAQPIKGTVFAWQPCNLISNPQDVGQQLCVPPFRVVCLYQVLVHLVHDHSF